MTGLDRMKAEAALSAAGLKWHFVPVDSTAPTRRSMRSSRRTRRLVRRWRGGPYIFLSYIANKPKSSAIPQIVGENEAEAGIALSKAGFTLGTVDMAYSPTVASGDVISSSPAPGAQEPAGFTVNIVVSQGAGVTVPLLLGDSESQAVAALTALGLIPQKGAPIATTVAGDVGNVAAQRVVGSSAQVGDQVPPGSIVIYRIGVAANSGVVSTTTTTTTLPLTTTTTTTTLPFPPNADHPNSRETVSRPLLSVGGGRRRSSVISAQARAGVADRWQGEENCRSGGDRTG